MGRGLQRPATENGQAVDVPALVSIFFPVPPDCLFQFGPTGGPIVNLFYLKAAVLDANKTETRVLTL